MNATRAPDIIVVGGGIVGTAAAAFLAQDGARVMLVERDGLASGASGANSGSVQHPFDPVLTQLYHPTLALYQRLTVDAPGFRIGERPAGLLLLAHDEATVRAEADAMTGAYPYLTTEVLGGADLQAIEPALAPDVWGCHFYVAYPIAPGAGTYAYATVAEERGVAIRAGKAAELEVEGDRVAGVRVDGRLLRADSVLAAAGPGTSALLDPTGAWGPIAPVWGVVVETAHAALGGMVLESVEPYGPGGLNFHYVLSDGAGAVGSTHLDDEPAPADWIERVLLNAAGFVPAIADAAIRSVRCCARPQSADGRPLIGWVPGLRGLAVCAGHGPWGVSTGPGSARLAADLLLGRSPVIPPELDPARFGAPRG
jgi:D-amino-acid dehydrogenase